MSVEVYHPSYPIIDGSGSWEKHWTYNPECDKPVELEVYLGGQYNPEGHVVRSIHGYVRIGSYIRIAVHFAGDHGKRVWELWELAKFDRKKRPSESSEEVDKEIERIMYLVLGEAISASPIEFFFSFAENIKSDAARDAVREHQAALRELLGIWP